jgi:predicted metal-dependent enzyme (double-stranded beta helix superfamily)
MRLVAGSALALAVVAEASAQAPSLETLCNPESNPYDAVAAAPYSHRVQFEDEHVRVLEIVLPPGAIEPVHIHALPSVIMGETGGKGGAKFIYTEYRFSNGKFIETSSNEVSPAAGYRAVWTAPEGPHSITNAGPVEVRFTRMEIKPEACSRR